MVFNYELAKNYFGNDFIFFKCLFASANFLGAKAFTFNLLRFSSTVRFTLRSSMLFCFFISFFIIANLNNFSFNEKCTDLHVFMEKKEVFTVIHLSVYFKFFR